MGRTPHRSRWGGGDEGDWAIAREAMAAVGVQHLADRPVEELSGGERRRVILAQALAQDAPVLLLDEPTTHLDIRHVIDVLAMVRTLAEVEAKAVLAVLHDLTLAASVCDRIVALHRGEVVAQGTPEAVVTRSLLRTIYEVDADVEMSRATGRPRSRRASRRSGGELRPSRARRRRRRPRGSADAPAGGAWIPRERGRAARHRHRRRGGGPPRPAPCERSAVLLDRRRQRRGVPRHDAHRRCGRSSATHRTDRATSEPGARARGVARGHSDRARRADAGRGARLHRGSRDRAVVRAPARGDRGREFDGSSFPFGE